MILAQTPLGFAWPTLDPFLFCVHHDDAYPAGDGRLGPAASLAERELGQDFTPRDGWRMYHGREVPGFPGHPHRGFETVTVVRRGLVDHCDSLGAAARYGRGDVQWLTAGAGIQHSEMFPLVDTAAPNPLELFQIWLNLPKADKMAPAHFAMFWAHQIRRHTDGGATVAVVAGSLGAAAANPPPPRSWAARAEADVAIWTIHLEPGARTLLPAARPGVNRVLYLFRGAARVAGVRVASPTAIQVRADAPLELGGFDDEAELLLLQGRPIGEPVANHGPFVMNPTEEIQQAYADYRRTRFGGWPWPSTAPTHPAAEGRFARHADGREERAED